MSYRFIRLLGLMLLVSLLSVAEEEPGQGLPNLLRGNEQFGRKLLMLVDSTAPARNVVVSPLSLTIILTALQNDLEGGPVRTEIADAFGWGEYPHLNVPARMLLVAFEKPQPLPPQSNRRLRSGPFPTPSREVAWITNSLLYRGKDTLLPRFVSNAQKYYGVNFRSTGTAKPTAADLKNDDYSGGTLPMIPGEDDILISSGSHLQTAWSGNTFSMSTPGISPFRTASGELKLVPMLESELKGYPYAKTDKFEAVALPCNSAYMVAALPAPGQSVHDLERLLTEVPDSLDAELKKQFGRVTMPTFHFQFEANLRQQIEQMGIREVFKDVGSIIKIPKSHLTQVSQNTDIQVDREGIRASAESVVGGVYGGIGNGQNAFRMELNRPFVFLIRDRTTNALLFLGVVADPTQP